MRFKLLRTVLLSVAIHCCFEIGTSEQVPGDEGRWEAPFNHVVPIHWELGQPGWDGEDRSPYADPADPHRFMVGQAALIPVGPQRGKVLALNRMRVRNGKQYWAIVDPLASPPSFSNFELSMPSEGTHLFCSGHAWNRDGHLLLCGGNEHKKMPLGKMVLPTRLCFRFDPTAPTGNAMWAREPDMYALRWYPTVTAMGTDGSGRDLLLVSGGSTPGAGHPGLAPRSYEAFDSAAPPGQGGWQPNPNNPGAEPYFDGPLVPCPDLAWTYPREVLLSSGRVFRAGIMELGSRLDHGVVAAGVPPVWEVQSQNAEFSRKYGSVVLLPNLGGPDEGRPDVVLRLGGGAQRWDYGSCTPLPQAPSDTVETCLADLDCQDPLWRWIPGRPLAFARDDPDATLLPDGAVLVTGGRRDTDLYSADQPVYRAELLDLESFEWRTLAPAAVRRGHHSIALLLPSGQVLTAGGESREMDYEIYQPPYLTNGSVRPEIVGAPETLEMQYGELYDLKYLSLPEGVSVERVVLMAPGAVTHSFDMHQRYVELRVERHVFHTTLSAPSWRVFFRAPRDSNRAPRGYYMLFLVTNSQVGCERGTPSLATWVKLE